MSIDPEVCNVSDTIYEMLHELPGPKDAAMALLMAHVRMTMDEGMDGDGIDGMLREYAQLFRTAYTGERPQ